MNIEFKIDYLQFSSNIQPRWIQTSIDDFRTKSNMSFYTHMTKYANGMRVYEGNPNTDKRLFVMSGKVCDTYGVTDSKFIKDLTELADTSVSRIDLAMTTDIKILDKFVADKDSIVSNKFNDMKIISDANYTPQTIYVGDMQKRGKKGIVRAYDKGLQLGLQETMNRIEIEFRRKDADIATRRLASGEKIADVMNSKFRIDTDWYRDMFGSGISTKRFDTQEEDDITEIQRKMAWLEKQVAPTLQYVIDYDRDNGTRNFERLINGLVF